MSAIASKSSMASYQLGEELDVTQDPPHLDPPICTAGILSHSLCDPLLKSSGFIAVLEQYAFACLSTACFQTIAVWILLWFNSLDELLPTSPTFLTLHAPSSLLASLCPLAWGLHFSSSCTVPVAHFIPVGYLTFHACVLDSVTDNALFKGSNLILLSSCRI